jgi:hypothetical protein
MPEKGRKKGKWRNFLGEQYWCEDGCHAEFELKEKHKQLIIPEDIVDEDNNLTFKAFFVKCPDCGRPIPLNPNYKNQKK